MTAFLWWYVVGTLLTPTIGAKDIFFVNPFFIFVGLIWVVSFGLFVMALNQLLLARPLYFFVSDTKAGDTHGQGLTALGAGWDVLSPAGNKIEGGAS